MGKWYLMLAYRKLRNGDMMYCGGKAVTGLAIGINLFTYCGFSSVDANLAMEARYRMKLGFPLENGML